MKGLPVFFLICALVIYGLCNALRSLKVACVFDGEKLLTGLHFKGKLAFFTKSNEIFKYSLNVEGTYCGIDLGIIREIYGKIYL